MQADQQALSAAEATLAQGESSAATYGQNAVYTMLPKVGQIVRRGQPLYAIGGEPAFLLYGGVPASRAFMSGMSPGADVAELNRNLRGYGAPSGDDVHRGDDARRSSGSSRSIACRRPGSCRSGRSCSSRARSG